MLIYKQNMHELWNCSSFLLFVSLDIFDLIANLTVVDLKLVTAEEMFIEPNKRTDYTL